MLLSHYRNGSLTFSLVWRTKRTEDTFALIFSSVFIYFSLSVHRKPSLRLFSILKKMDEIQPPPSPQPPTSPHTHTLPTPRHPPEFDSDFKMLSLIHYCHYYYYHCYYCRCYGVNISSRPSSFSDYNSNDDKIIMIMILIIMMIIIIAHHCMTAFCILY